jgi:hypothetical protein
MIYLLLFTVSDRGKDKHKFVSIHARRAYGGSGAYIHSFLTSVLGGGEWSVSHPASLATENDPSGGGGGGR